MAGGVGIKWSIKIGKFVGIDVYMHLTFLLLVGWGARFACRPGNAVGLRPGDPDRRFHRPDDRCFVRSDGLHLQSVAAVHRAVHLDWHDPRSGIDPNEIRRRRHPGSPGDGQ